jgi:hypothetical protein
MSSFAKPYKIKHYHVYMKDMMNTLVYCRCSGELSVIIVQQAKKGVEL